MWLTTFVLHESVFRTTDLPVADRFEAWAERMGNTHAPMHLTSDRTADYHGHQRVIGLGDVTVWPATFDHLVFRRTPKLIRQSDPETYHLSLLLKGEGAADWGRQQAAYRMNDFHINSSSRSWEVLTGSDSVTIVGLEVPRALVAVPGNRADQVLGSLLSGREGIGALLSQLLRQLVADTSPTSHPTHPGWARSSPTWSRPSSRTPWTPTRGCHRRPTAAHSPSMSRRSSAGTSATRT